MSWISINTRSLQYEDGPVLAFHEAWITPENPKGIKYGHVFERDVFISAERDEEDLRTISYDDNILPTHYMFIPDALGQNNRLSNKQIKDMLFIIINQIPG